MPNVFISYRRTDAAGYAEWIRGRLQSALGPAWVVMDDYAPRFERGVPFEDQLGERLARTDVVLVLIGLGWLHATDDAGQLCLENVDDYVRLELESAFEAGAVVVPVLVGGVEMPTAAELPRTLAPLACRAAVNCPRPDDSAISALLEAIECKAPQRVRLGERRFAQQSSDAIFGPRRGRAKLEDPSERLAILLERAVRKGIVPAGAQALAPHAPPRPSGSEPTDTPNTRAGRKPDKQAQPRKEPQGPRRRAAGEVEHRAIADRPEPMAPPPAPPQSVAPSPRPSKPIPQPAAASHWRARGASRLWLKFAGAAAIGAALYELARQVFGSRLFTAELSPSGAGNEDGDLVDCTVFAPNFASPGESLLLQVFAHLAEQTEDARALATEFDPGTQRRAYRSLEAPVPRGAVLTFELDVQGADIGQSIETMTWRGRAESVQFEVVLPPTVTGSLFGTIWVSRDGGPLGHVKFKLAVRSDAQASAPVPVGDTAVRYSAAFVSYAAVDRHEVMRRVQILQALKIQHFQDLLELEPGDRWWPRLESAINECDLFLLFWSSGAKRSEWVRKEVLHALARQGGDQLSPPEIRPVILEGPPFEPPWDELSHLHFNDKLLYFMSTAEQNDSS